jgi:hypothetical protein
MAASGGICFFLFFMPVLQLRFTISFSSNGLPCFVFKVQPSRILFFRLSFTQSTMNEGLRFFPLPFSRNLLAPFISENQRDQRLKYSFPLQATPDPDPGPRVQQVRPATTGLI